MSIAWGILALALAGSDPVGGGALVVNGVAVPPQKKATLSIRIVRPGGSLPIVGRLMSNAGVRAIEPEQVSYEVRVVDTPALVWREAFYRHCTRVGREGRSTVWTVDEATVGGLLKQVQGSPRSNVVQAPKVTAFAGAAATVDTRHPRFFVVDIDRVAEGPVDRAAAVAYRPSIDEVRDGLALTIAGKRTAAGVRSHLKVESTWVGHVAEAKTTETIKNKAYGQTSLSAEMQLPQVVDAKVEGDYEIPAGHQLLASLGTVTAVDVKGEPIVMERLLLIAARPILTEAEESRIGRPSADAKVRPASVEIPAPPGAEPFIANKAYAEVMASVDAPADAKPFVPGQGYAEFVKALGEAPLVPPKGMPPLPSRSPLTPVGPDGKVVELPPLPDEFVAEAESLVTSGPQASPQSRHAIRATSPSPSSAPVVRPEPMPSGRSTLQLDGHELASGRSQTLRIPLGGALAIEVQARLVPAERPE